MRFPATIASTLLILVAVLLPGSSVPDVGVSGIDKLAHFVLFTIWSVAVRRDFGESFRWYWVLLAGILFSVLTELLQIAVEGRSFDVYDIIMDAAGIIFGIMTGSFFLRILRSFLTH